MVLPAILLASVTSATPVNAYLPDHLRDDFRAAAAAELDPTRGPANARQILQRAQRDHPKSPADQLSVQLRIAALELRQTFLRESKLDLGARHEQALTTFSRLDLTEPGFSAWLKRTLDHRPDVKKRLGASPTLSVAVLTRGAIARAQVQAALREALEQSRLPLRLRFASTREAEYALRVSAENVTAVAGRPGLGIQVLIESREPGTTGKQRARYALEAADPSAAAKAGADWVARIGGRDLVARFLADRGLTMMISGPLVDGAVPGLPAPHDHEHEH